MSRIALVLVVGLVLAGSAWSAGSVGKPRFTLVRVCSYTAFSRGRCTTDERDSTVQSNVLACSFTVEASQGGTVSAFWRYNGIPGVPGRFPYAAGSTGSGSIAYGTGSRQPVPGGTYTCVLRAGSAEATAVITSSGPTGAIVDAAACSGAQASRLGENRLFPVCPLDESAKPVAGAGAGSVVCNAVYPSEIGKQAVIELLRGATVVGHQTFSIADPLTQGYLERPSDVNPTPLEPGTYTCRFTITGGEAVTKSFAVVPGAPSPRDAATQVLRELSELHVRQFDVICVPHDLLQLIASPDQSVVVLGAARIKGTSMLLDEKIVCAPLAAYAAAEPTSQLPSATLLALSVVAHEYGHTLGLKRENVVECFAARVVWKWARRSNLAPSVLANAHRLLLDNRDRPPAYKLLPSCTLPT